METGWRARGEGSEEKMRERLGGRGQVEGSGESAVFESRNIWNPQGNSSPEGQRGKGREKSLLTPRPISPLFPHSILTASPERCSPVSPPLYFSLYSKCPVGDWKGLKGRARGSQRETSSLPRPSPSFPPQPFPSPLTFYPY